MLLTFKSNLILTPESEQILIKMQDEARILYNKLLADKIEYYEVNKKYLSYYTQQKELKNYKTEYLLYDVKKEVLRRLEANFKSYFKLLKNKTIKAKPPKFRGKNYFFTLQFIQAFTIKNKQIFISTINKNCKKLQLDIAYDLPINGINRNTNDIKLSPIKQLTIFKKDNKYFFSVIYEIPDKINNTNKVIAIDLGKKNIASIYIPDKNKGIILNSDKLSTLQKYYDNKIDQVKSLRDTKKKGSIKRLKLTKLAKKIQAKKTNSVKNILHKTTKEIANLNTNVIIGELTNMKQKIVTDNKNINKALQNNWPIQTFVNQLSYKTKLKGNKLIKVNEAWTSKTCCNCGSINYDQTLEDREYICDCGLKINRDLNGAINIFKRYSGDYNPPVGLQEIVKHEIFYWCKTNKMNQFNLKALTSF